MAKQRSLPHRLWYSLLRLMCQFMGVTCLQMRCGGRENVPRQGGVLVLSNHQSHLDPMLVGAACPRHMNYLARKSLFGFAPFRWLIASLDAIPLDRQGLGLAGIKETLKRLKRGEMVLIFPEGTRSRDGELGPLKPGFCSLARRTQVPLLPMAIAGAYDAWPRTRWAPCAGTVHVYFGPPIQPAELAAWDDQQLISEVRQRISDCHEYARRQRRLGLGYAPRPTNQPSDGAIGPKVPEIP